MITATMTTVIDGTVNWALVARLVLGVALLWFIVWIFWEL